MRWTVVRRPESVSVEIRRVPRVIDGVLATGFLAFLAFADLSILGAAFDRGQDAETHLLLLGVGVLWTALTAVAALRWTWVLFGAETITVDGSSIVSEFRPAVFRKRRRALPTGLVAFTPLANRKFGWQFMADAPFAAADHGGLRVDICDLGVGMGLTQAQAAAVANDVVPVMRAWAGERG